MAIKYSLHETPVPSGRENKKTKHARVIQNEKVDMDKMCEYVSALSSFSSADVKGVLEAFQHWMGKFLVNGDSFELDGLGHFYPTLKSKSSIDENGKEKVEVWVDTVGFRCSPKLKKQVRSAKLEKVTLEEKKKLTIQQRKENILWYVNEHGSITSSKIMKLNKCSRVDALSDLKALLSTGELKNISDGNQLLCVLK